MIIKVATQPDDINLDQVVLLLSKLDRIHHESAPERFPLFPLDQRKQDLISLFKKGCIFYVEDEVQVIAFASVINKGESLLIEHLFVEPEFRLQKIATKLIEAILSKFPNKEIFASAYAFNTDAIQFYQKLFKLSSLVFKKDDKE